MQKADMEILRSVLVEHRKNVEASLPDLDTAISRLDELIDTESQAEEQRTRIRHLSDIRRSVS